MGFKEWLLQQEGFMDNIKYWSQSFNTDSKTKQKANAIDQMNNAYNQAQVPINNAIKNMRQADVQGSSYVNKPWQQMGTNFGKVKNLARLNNIPVRGQSSAEDLNMQNNYKQMFKNDLEKEVGTEQQPQQQAQTQQQIAATQQQRSTGNTSKPVADYIKNKNQPQDPNNSWGTYQIY